MLVPRLDVLIPTQWMSNTFTDGVWERDEHKMIIGRVAEMNPEWVIEVVNNLEHKLSDVLHDFRGIYSEDEHFVPRISTEVSEVYGYRNIQTYRLCGVLDNTEYHTKGLFDYFFDLVRDGEFEESDYEVIDWNEVVKRYSNQQRSHYLGSVTKSYHEQRIALLNKNASDYDLPF